MEGDSERQKIKSQKVQKQIYRVYQNEMAAKLIDGIDKLYYYYEDSARRWVWELIQNAKDVADGKIKIEIHFLQDELIFIHSGKPFIIEDIAALLHQSSMKNREAVEPEASEENQTPETTGKFGTGFITTHLLSKIVEIQGIYYDEEMQTHQNFTLVLDRSPKDKKLMIEKYMESFKIFDNLDDYNECPLIENFQPENQRTQFRYKLDQEGKEAAQIGIQDFKLCVQLMLTFNEIIDEITLNEQNQTITNYKFVDKQEMDEGIYLVSVQQNQDLKYFIISNTNKQTSLAVEVTNLSNLELIPPNKKAPILYADFPLIGSEVFGFPTCINSHRF